MAVLAEKLRRVLNQKPVGVLVAEQPDPGILNSPFVRLSDEVVALSQIRLPPGAGRVDPRIMGKLRDPEGDKDKTFENIVNFECSLNLLARKKRFGARIVSFIRPCHVTPEGNLNKKFIREFLRSMGREVIESAHEPRF